MKPNTTILIIVTFFVAVGAYWYFFTDTGNKPPLTTLSSSTNQAQSRFQTLVGELQPVSFNTDIFSDSRFNALVDLATPIAPETAGRIDPFAPVSASINEK